MLFGTDQQQQEWLPRLATGEWLSAFALTEPEAGSDAANVQTMAVPKPDGSGYVLNGEKRWITNGGIAHVLTVMARTPVPGSNETKITSYLVTPNMKGFKVTEQRMEKCGVRGTVTSRLAFQDMFVPAENVLGEVGKGLRVALTVLDYGRTTFGASCTGAAWFCVQRATEHANRRVQFGKPIGSFELVQRKLADMRAGAYAMECCTYQTAALVDAGDDDFMLETAMLKVFSTDLLWKIVNDTIQIHGGKAYFTDEPFERMMRDARINMIGEGANDVLRVFIALVGMRDVGLELEGILAALHNPWGQVSQLGRFTARQVASVLAIPEVEVKSAGLETDAVGLGRATRSLGRNVQKLLARYKTDVLDRQHHLARIADAATELYVSACVLRQLDALPGDRSLTTNERRVQLFTGRYYLASARRRIRQNLRALWDNDDNLGDELANRMLGSETESPHP